MYKILANPHENMTSHPFIYLLILFLSNIYILKKSNQPNRVESNTYNCMLSSYHRRRSPEIVISNNRPHFKTVIASNAIDYSLFFMHFFCDRSV